MLGWIVIIRRPTRKSGLAPGRGLNFWGVHDMAVDQEGNFYVAEVNKGGAQKFRPRPGANPDFLVGRPVYSAWE